MKKTRIDKIGTITSKVHDTKSKFLIGEEKSPEEIDKYINIIKNM